MTRRWTMGKHYLITDVHGPSSSRPWSWRCDVDRTGWMSNLKVDTSLGGFSVLLTVQGRYWKDYPLK